MLRLIQSLIQFVAPAPRGLRLLLAGSLACLLSSCILVTNTTHRTTAAETATPAINFKDPVLNQRKIVITTDLDEPTAQATILKLQYLDSLGNEAIDLYLDTDGGPAENAFSIIDVMRSLRSPVNTWAMGNCNSGGAMILAAGTGRRFVFANAVIAIHGGKKVGRVPGDYMRIVNRQIETLWQQRAKLPADWYPLRGDVMHFVSSDKALEYGIVDEIAKPQRPVTPGKGEGAK